MENSVIKRVYSSHDILDVENSLEHRILSKKNIDDDIACNLTQYAVYYLDDVALGYIAYANCIDHIDIISIAVKPSYRNKKVASKLFDFLENENNKNLTIFLEVRKSNLPAIALYNSLGFKCISTRKKYYSLPTEDAYIFSK